MQTLITHILTLKIITIKALPWLEVEYSLSKLQCVCIEIIMTVSCTNCVGSSGSYDVQMVW